MPPRDYSHQDLQNRSFKGQDLTGADFSHSDLRGCNFSGATLTAANFQGCRTGQSRRQLFTRIAVAVAVAAIAAFSRGAVLEGMAYSFLSLLLFRFAIHSFWELVKTIRHAAGTDFDRADLSRANFSHATLHNTDFSRAGLDWVNWTGVEFSRCKFPRDFEDQGVIALCVARAGRGQEYRHAHAEFAFTPG